jgi:hypothetical protein
VNEIQLTPEQEAEAARIEDIVKAGAAVEIRQMARLLASKCNRELLGETEFQIRDAVHRLGARAVDTALQERKKGGIKDPAHPAPAVTGTPASSATAR